MKQKGFTLIELVVALGIATVVLSGVVTSIFMIMRGTQDISGESAALANIEYAAHWLTRDMMMAQVTDLDKGAEDPVSTVNMTWKDYTGGMGNEISHYVVYTHSGTELLREYDSADNTTIVGRNLSYVGFSLDDDEPLVTVTLTSRATYDSTVTRTYVLRIIGEE